MIYEKIYLDMDGVLVDFNKSALHILNMPFNEYETIHGPIKIWEEIYKNPSFFEKLSPKPEYKKIVNLCKKNAKEVCILSSPSKINSSLCILQKRKWINRYLGKNFPAFFEREKHKFAGLQRLLIDDTPKKLNKWTEAGGIGYLYISFDNLYHFLNKNRYRD